MVVFLKILLRLESVIIISLFVIFFFLFGLPAYWKYRMEDVIIKEIKKLEEPVESPAVTVCLDFVSFKLVDWNSNICRFIDTQHDVCPNYVTLTVTIHLSVTKDCVSLSAIFSWEFFVHPSFSYNYYRTVEKLTQ